MANDLIPLDELKQMATYVCKGNLFGMPSPEATLSLMLLSQADGIHPMTAMRKYHIIKGRPSMRAEAMLADFQSNGGKIQWLKRCDTECSAKFSHPSGGELEVCWTIERAKKAGLTGNPTWSKFPTQMLSARCISEGVRAVFPAVVCGVYTPEEIQDFDAPKAEVKPVEAVPVAEVIPTKVETVKAEVVEVKPVEEPKTDSTSAKEAEVMPYTAEDHAKLIYEARKHMREIVGNSRAEYNAAITKIFGKVVELTSMNREELLKVMEYKGEQNNG